MKKKNILMFLGAISLALGAFAVLSLNKTKCVSADETIYALNLSNISASDVSKGSTTVKTNNGNDIDFDISNAESVTEGIVKLNLNGYVGNNTQISGISKIEVNSSSGSFNIKYGINNDNLNLHSENFDTSLTQHFNYFLESPANYFRIVALSDNTVLDSLRIIYSCTPAIDDNPKLKTAVFADIQLCNDIAVPGEAAVNLGNTVNAALALRDHFNFCKEEGVDVIFMNGDVVNNAAPIYYQRYQNIFESVYGTDESKYPEIIWSIGNHEWWDLNEHDTSSAISLFNAYSNIDSPYLVKRSAVPYYLDSSVTVPTYYKVVNGVPFLCVSGENSSGQIGTTLANEIASWLEEMEALPSVQAGGPIYVAYHWPLKVTLTHGTGASDRSDVFYNLLKDYPQAVVFSGDTHYSGVNERAINQVDFTNINVGSSSYSRMDKRSATMPENESFYNLEHKNGAAKDTLIGNASFLHEYTQTIPRMDTMESNSTVINRYFSSKDYSDAKHLGKTWNIPAHSNKTNFSYTNDRFVNTNSAQYLYNANGVSFANDAHVTYEVKDGQMTVRFPDAIEYHYTEHYKITVQGNTSKVYDCVSNYYKWNDAPTNNYYVLKDLPEGDSYTVTVQAFDYFDNPSLNTLTATEPTVGAAVDTLDNALTNTYCDISTRLNVDDTCPNSATSVEYYYHGLYPYNAGAIANRIIYSSDPSTNCANLVTLNNAADAEPILQAKVKVLSDADIIAGLTVVDGSGTWKSDFGNESRQTIPADGSWHEVKWNLRSLYGITCKTNLTNLAFKFKSSSTDTVNGYVMNFLLDDIDLVDGHGVSPEPENRGNKFESNTDYTEDIAPVTLDKKITIDFKFLTEGNVAIMLGQGWDKYYGYYDVYSEGTLSPSHDGVTISPLDDGYFRVVFDLSQLNKVAQTEPDSYIDLIYIRGIWSSASGYIDVNPTGGGDVVRGRAFTAGKDLDQSFTPSISLDQTLVFDVRFTSGTKINVMLGQGWSKYFGYFAIKSNGTLSDNYDGVSIEALSDGYYRVTFVLSQLTKVADMPAPDSYIDMLYIRGVWSDASGYIDFVS